MGGMLLRGGCVLSLDKGVGNLRDADVLIEDGKVAAIDRGLRSRGAETVEVADTIVMPGFVDTHRHVWTTLFRNLGGNQALADALPDRARHCEPDDVYAATLVGLWSAVAAGITTVVDWADVQLDDRYTEATLQAHLDAGVRTVLVHVVPSWVGADPGEALRRVVARDVARRAPMTTIAFGHPDASLSDAGQLESRWSLARQLGVRIHAHAGVEASGRGTVAGLGRRGLLGGDVTLVHCCGLGDDDLDAIASHGAMVALTPSTQMATGVGPPPVQQLVDRGIRPGLGVDNDMVTPGDLFSQMRSAQSLQHAGVFDRKLAGKAATPSLLSTREVIRYATTDGARVAGLGELTGSLAIGKQADIVVLRTDGPNIAPVNDPIGAVVWGMDASNIEHVLVGGTPLVRHGVLQADVERAYALLTAAGERLAGATGHLVDTGDGGLR